MGRKTSSIAHKKRQLRVAQDTRMKAAIAEFRKLESTNNAPKPSARDIALRHQVPPTTLRCLLAGGIPISEFNASKRHLAPAEQRVILHFAKSQAKKGFPLSHRLLESRANAILTAFPEGCIERRPDIYLSELQENLEAARGIITTMSTIQRTLLRRGFSRKRVTRDAAEQSEDARDRYLLQVGQYDPEMLVFVDESAYNRHVSRRTYGWAPIGTRSRRRDFFIRGTRYLMLPALSLEGILHLSILPHSFNAASFRLFIDGLLDEMHPYPGPNSVIVMDNASIHKGPGLCEMIEERGMRLLYLPPYSPDLNPIEEAFSSIKAWIRWNHDYVLSEMTGEATCDPYHVLGQGVFSVTAEKAEGWYRDCGYIA
ncbi:hypothetical protein FRC01_008402 [Tulasnella sp. 417]|nr:hypothetical protein FRC01_008402 [Tulasnella sp. 417]